MGLFFTLFLLFTVSSIKCHAQSVDTYIQRGQKFIESAEWNKAAKQWLTAANLQYADRIPDIDLATDLLELVALNDLSQHYRFANSFYNWTIRNSSFQKNPEQIVTETNLIISILADSSKTYWKSLLENKNDALLTRIGLFWATNDPLFSTPVNERLIEHWKRIGYSRNHFTKNKNSPYATDDRGTIYVQYGKPDYNIEKHLTINQITASEMNWRFRLNNPPEIDFELWRYLLTDKNEEFYYIFGKKDGIGSFGLRSSIMDVMDFSSHDIIVEGTQNMSPLRRQRIAENIFVLGVFEKLAPYHPSFEKQYENLTFKMFAASDFSETDNNRSESDRNSGLFSRSFNRFMLESIIRSNTVSKMNKAPADETTVIPYYKKLNPDLRVYQLRNEDGKAENLVAIKTNIKKKLNKNEDSLSNYEKLILNLGMEAYTTSGKKIFFQNYPAVISEKNISSPGVYSIKAPDNGNLVFYSCEVINPAPGDVEVPSRLSGSNPKIILASGRKKLSFPRSTISTSTFDISDIVLGDDQEPDTKLRLPVTPNISHRFAKDSTIMIYFEAYNIPAGGYKTTYHFEKDRFLFFGKKEIEDKAGVTILSDKAKGRDTQFFSISLKDLEPDEYTLLFDFESLKGSKTITRELEIKVVDSEDE